MNGGNNLSVYLLPFSEENVSLKMNFSIKEICLRLTGLWGTTGEQVRVHMPSVWAVRFLWGEDCSYSFLWRNSQ